MCLQSAQIFHKCDMQIVGRTNGKSLRDICKWVLVFEEIKVEKFYRLFPCG